MLRYFEHILGGANLINAESVKARLKNNAKESGILFQDALTIYCLERTIYRISVSRFIDNFALKGGIFLYAKFDGEFSRATSDIDLLGLGIDNSVDKITEVFEEIFSVNAQDAIDFDMDTLAIKRITEFKDYPGLNVSIIAKLDRTRVPVTIDIGFSDVVYPDKCLMEFPTILEMESPKVYAYSLATVVAEKFEAIVSLGYANSRFKDFYDIYFVSRAFRFNGDELKKAVQITFENRKTGFDDIVAFDRDFCEDKVRHSRWKSFVKKKLAMAKLEFDETIQEVKNFLEPIVIAIKRDQSFSMIWSEEHLKWK